MWEPHVDTRYPIYHCLIPLLLYVSLLYGLEHTHTLVGSNMFIVLIGMFHLDVPCVFLGLDGPTPQCFSRILIPKNGQTKPEFLSFK